MSSLAMFEYLFAFILGTIVGSFANVCIHRLPWRLSLVVPGSHCPQCQQSIRPWHNIPLLSYVWLGGRCAYCSVTIPWRYPCVELLCGLLYVFLYYHVGSTVQGMIFVGLATALLIVSFIDLAHTIVPDTITLPGIVIGFMTSLTLTSTGLVNALIGFALGGGLFLLIALVSRGGMGGGDIKLIAMIGAFLGWQAVLVTILFGAFLGALVGLSLIVCKKKGRKDPVPFGPFLAFGALIAMVWGEELFVWYLHASP